jgi:hypothetical protein
MENCTVAAEQDVQPGRNKSARSEPRVIEVEHSSEKRGRLKAIGGSQSDRWNNFIVNQTMQCLWRRYADRDAVNDHQKALVAGLIGIGPRDELEGMIAAQLIACHGASMECYRRAMIGDQTFEGRRENLSQANKLSRTYATLLESLNRHRGKGAQKVTVEHVHVHAGGQAVVGNVETPGGGDRVKTEGQPHALAHAPGAKMPSPDTPREPVPVACDEERPMSDARRNVTRGAEGE